MRSVSLCPGFAVLYIPAKFFYSGRGGVGIGVLVSAGAAEGVEVGTAVGVGIGVGVAVGSSVVLGDGTTVSVGVGARVETGVGDRVGSGVTAPPRWGFRGSGSVGSHPVSPIFPTPTPLDAPG